MFGHRHMRVVRATSPTKCVCLRFGLHVAKFMDMAELRK
jgi:hypothetical protein